MVVKYLEPRLELLREEYVLIQAWKKTAAYIRYHNSFADTLALDRTAVNLPEFLHRLRERLKSSDRWKNDPLRIVPAPKSQDWQVQGNQWRPKKDADLAALRPLAHVSLEDQVIATAVMLCLADRVETWQGDPRTEIHDQKSRKQIISYGNRLFCDQISGNLRHRWGASNLYRKYFQDYRKFLSRPEATVESISKMEDRDMYVIHTDLKKFYDRVRPNLLLEATKQIRQSDDDPKFFSFLKSVFNWEWDSRDKGVAQKYATKSDINDFTQIALPQGLVASGFFANLVLLPFDDELRAKIGEEILGGILLVDVCRYVDDLRLLVAVDKNQCASLEDIVKRQVFDWLEQKLAKTAPGLELSDEKTKILELGGETPHLLAQGKKMNRIQTAISGGFDTQGGEEILNAILGMLRTQTELKLGDNENFSLIPDVRDVTVTRFAARRYRSTFRSIRPLLPEEDDTLSQTSLPQLRSRLELDQEAKGFAFGLIQRWISDPSNVLLMRIGLDLWPDAEVLQYILTLLRPFIEESAMPIERRQIAWYCLSEIFRAGATETGLVPDNELLPSGVCLENYREVLHKEAMYLSKPINKDTPWYLRQQALLFLATYAPNRVSITYTESVPEEIQRYWEMVQFLRGDELHLSDSNFATLAILSRRAFLDHNETLNLIRNSLNKARMKKIAEREPSFALELFNAGIDSEIISDLPERIYQDLCLVSKNSEKKTLSNEILDQTPLIISLRNELSLLYFTEAFLEKWLKQSPASRVITPEQITLKLEKNADNRIDEMEVLGLDITPENEDDSSTSIYSLPSWCDDGDQWRIQLGFLLRFILSRHPDFTRHVRPTHWTENESIYRPVRSHWYLRLYGLYNGQSAFGDNWLPITEWFEKFLLALLAWPGCRAPEEFGWVEQGIDATRNKIQGRINTLKNHHGAASRTLILPIRIKQPTEGNTKRSLRACIVQTVFPSDDEFRTNDLALNNPQIRQKHRNHLLTALATVNRMLILRNTYEKSNKQLDWLILPELAVHPEDIRACLIPFARAHKAIILTGLTYEEIFKGEPLVNSALWIIPEHSETHGLQIQIRRQGKRYLAKDERAFNSNCKKLVQEFRPCQWLIGYPWSGRSGDPPLWLTAAVCYDATDLALAADLRKQSDIFAIPALNKDIGTFDQMAMALHYHMFQYVIVANNGKYGGSNAYFPHKKPYTRKIFHTHGQPQATISFLEIEDISTFQKRTDVSSGINTENIENDPRNDYKSPPAGLGEDSLSPKASD